MAAILSRGRWVNGNNDNDSQTTLQSNPGSSPMQILSHPTPIDLFHNKAHAVLFFSHSIHHTVIYHTVFIFSLCYQTTDGSSTIFNSLAPGEPRCHFKTAIFNLVLLIGIFTPSKDNALRWIPRDLNDDKSTLVQVMAWCRQATSHYLSQCWASSMSPYGVTRPQWVNSTLKLQQNGR